MNSIVFASNNPAKISFVKKMFSQQLPVTISAQKEHGIEEVDEDKATFFENALLKARNACLHTNLPAIADDSGLLVKSLGDKPGVKTNRYAGEGKTREESMKQLLNELKGKTGSERIARFICTMVFLRDASDPTPLFFQHELLGEIAEHPKGQGQFGFDSIFYLPAYRATFAELVPSIQDREDPRTHVLNQLIKHLKFMLAL